MSLVKGVLGARLRPVTLGKTELKSQEALLMTGWWCDHKRLLEHLDSKTPRLEDFLELQDSRTPGDPGLLGTRASRLQDFIGLQFSRTFKTLGAS